jgi:hypothetical protein
MEWPLLEPLEATYSRQAYHPPENVKLHFPKIIFWVYVRFVKARSLLKYKINNF